MQRYCSKSGSMRIIDLVSHLLHKTTHKKVLQHITQYSYYFCWHFSQLQEHFMFVTTDTYKMENRKSKLNALLTKFKIGKHYYLALKKKITCHLENSHKDFQHRYKSVNVSNFLMYSFTYPAQSNSIWENLFIKLLSPLNENICQKTHQASQFIHMGTKEIKWGLIFT